MATTVTDGSDRQHSSALLVGIVAIVVLCAGGFAAAIAYGGGGSASRRAPERPVAALAGAAARQAAAPAPAGDTSVPFLAYLADARMSAGGSATFGTFVRLANAARLTSVFNGPGPMAVFAPTDEAFARAFTAAQLAALERDRIGLARLMSYHVAPGPWSPSQIGGVIPTLETSELHGATAAGVVRVDGVAIRAADIKVANGNIYVLDGVLLPPGFQVPTVTR